MKFLEKLENALNNILLLLGGLFVRLLKKILPLKIQLFFMRLQGLWIALKGFLRNLPELALVWIKKSLIELKLFLASLNVKKMLREAYAAALKNHSPEKPQAKKDGFKTALAAPFILMGHWLKGLSMTQTLLLLGFTGASFLATVSIIFSSKRLVDQQTKTYRIPASTEEEISFDRPNYYKKGAKHYQLTNVRLPVYFAKVNELKSVDIDFNATVSNRMTRILLEKLEFKLRDHLILTMEPIQASWTLEEEGKEVIRDKIFKEINEFLVAQKIDGSVKELEITYILAN